MAGRALALVRRRPGMAVLVGVGAIAATGIVVTGDVFERAVLLGYGLLWLPDLVRWHRRRKGS